MRTYQSSRYGHTVSAHVSLRPHTLLSQYLLYWARASPPVALALLQKRFQSHPLVTQYAVRVLHSFPPATIIYYIPQLVQALRHDRTGTPLCLPGTHAVCDTCLQVLSSNTL